MLVSAGFVSFLNDEAGLRYHRSRSVFEGANTGQIAVEVCAMILSSFPPLRRQMLMTCDAPLRLVDLPDAYYDALRVSLTDRCNLRCSYCMPPKAWTGCPPRKP